MKLLTIFLPNLLENEVPTQSIDACLVANFWEAIRNRNLTSNFWPARNFENTVSKNRSAAPVRLATRGYAWPRLATLGYAWLLLATLGYACLRLATLGYTRVPQFICLLSSQPTRYERIIQFYSQTFSRRGFFFFVHNLEFRIQNPFFHVFNMLE